MPKATGMQPLRSPCKPTKQGSRKSRRWRWAPTIPNYSPSRVSQGMSSFPDMSQPISIRHMQRPLLRVPKRIRRWINMHSSMRPRFIIRKPHKINRSQYGGARAESVWTRGKSFDAGQQNRGYGVMCITRWVRSAIARGKMDKAVRAVA